MTDPILTTLAKWEQEAQILETRLRDERGAALCRAHIQDLRDALDRIAQYPVPYRDAPRVTGYALGSLKNMRLKNIGGRRSPAFALGDLPFRAGCASPARLIHAYRELRGNRAA